MKCSFYKIPRYSKNACYIVITTIYTGLGYNSDNEFAVMKLITFSVKYKY